jgi:hypothetical protein
MADKLFDVDFGVKVGTGYWFSSNGNISIPGTISAGALAVTGETSITNISIENTVYQYADNLSSPNVWITGGAIGVATTGTVSPVANVYAGLGQFNNLSVANLLVTGESVTTLVATNFSSGNIYQSAAGTFVADNFSSGNIYQSAAGTFVADNFSSGNIYQTGTGQSIQSANVQIGTNWGTTSRANLLVANVSGFGAGQGLNATLGNITTLGATNFTANTVLITKTNDTANVRVNGNIVIGNMPGNLIVQGNAYITNGAQDFAANSVMPKQYTDVMTIVFGT